ncbi:MAG: type VI secretion system Vgr family protein [Rhodocyclaceae bacterium]
MHRPLVAHTPLRDALWVVSLEGVEAMSELYEFRVGLKSEDANVDCQALIGEVCAVELEGHNGVKRFFSGQMVRFEALGKRGEHWHYEALVAPKLWHASRRGDFRIRQNMTVQDIVTEVLGLNAIRHEWRLKQSYKTWVYNAQYGETDLSYICRLLEHEGIFFWFEHSAAGEVLVLADHFSTPEPFGGYERTPFFPPDHARAQEDHFFSWRLAREVEPGVFKHSDYDFKKPSADLTTEYADPRGHLFDQYEIFSYPGNYVERGDGDSYANARLEAMQVQQDRIILEGRVRGATPGYRFELFNHPRADQNRELIVMRAAYRAANNAYEGAGGSESSHYQVRIEAIPSDRPFRPVLRTPKPRSRGPETAVVVGPAGTEIHTDEYGRVKVHFHWDRYGQKDGEDSCWIRVAHPWAGANYGAIHIPRVGQEVIVDYEHGDPDRPIITGRVYNAEQMPPWGLPANKTQSGILTRSSMGGSAANANAIRFEDLKGSEQVWVHAEKNLDTEVENCETHSVQVDRSKSIGNDESNTIGHDRKTAVRNEETFFVGANRHDGIGKTYLLEAGDKIRLVCGETVIEMTKEGQLSIKCKNFNITADESGQINTLQSVLDLNMDNRAATTAPDGDGDKGGIVQATESHFQ